MSAPEIRHGKILWPNTTGESPNAVVAQVHAAALREAESSIGEGDMIFDLQVHGGVAQKGTGARVMVWSYSYQVVPPGPSSAVARPR
jgi:hypothetical protein